MITPVRHEHHAPCKLPIQAPQFKMVRRERKRATTETKSFWTMPDLMQGPYQESPSRDGWVVDTPQR